MNESAMTAKFDGVKLRHIDAASLETVDECVYVLNELDRTIASMEAQIRNARAAARFDGEYSDRRWYMNVHLALKGTKRTRAAVQERRGSLARAEKKKLQETEDRRFVDTAERLLPRDIYLMLRDEVRAATKQPDPPRGEEGEA